MPSDPLRAAPRGIRTQYSNVHQQPSPRIPLRSQTSYSCSLPRPITSRGTRTPLRVGREIEGERVLWIEENASKRTAVTPGDVLTYVTTHYNLPVTRGWVNSFLLRNSERFCKMTSVPQETPRLEVPRCFLDETIQGITQFVLLNLFATGMKLAFPSGKTANRRR
jgi:hypothetical protein